MKQNPINRIKLLMSYDMSKTLNENIESTKIINEDNVLDIDEAGGEFGLAKDLAAAGKEAEKIAHLAQFFKMSEDAVKLGAAKDLTTLSKDLEKAALKDFRGGFKGGGNALGAEAKMIAKQKAVKEILSSQKELTETDIVNIIERVKKESKATALKIETRAGAKGSTKTATTGAKGAEDVVAAGKDMEGAKVVQTGDGMQIIAKDGSTVNVGYAFERSSQEGANVLKQDAKVLEGEAKSVAEENAKAVAEIKPSAWEKIKGVAKKLNKKWLWKLGLLAGGGYLIYRFFFGKGTVTPEDKKPLSKCLTELLDNDKATCQATTSGDPVVMVASTGNSDYDSKKGLKFYHNGRVFMGDNSKRGTWSCKGGEMTTSQIAEQDSNNDVLKNINIAWDGQSSGGGDNGGGDNGGGNADDNKPQVSFHDCSQKDVNKEDLEFGCKSPQIKELQKCLGLEEKYQTGNFGPITMKAIGGNVITKEVYDKIMAKCKGTEPVTGTTTGGTPTVTGTTTGSTVTPEKPEEPKPEEDSDVFAKMTGQQIYAKLKENFKLYRETEDKSTFDLPFIKARGRSVVLKGDIDPYKALPKLDEFIKTAFGMTRDSEGAKKVTNRYGEKFVWSK